MYPTTPRPPRRFIKAPHRFFAKAANAEALHRAATTLGINADAWKRQTVFTPASIIQFASDTRLTTDDAPLMAIFTPAWPVYAARSLPGTHVTVEVGRPQHLRRSPRIRRGGFAHPSFNITGRGLGFAPPLGKKACETSLTGQTRCRVARFPGRAPLHWLKTEVSRSDRRDPLHWRLFRQGRNPSLSAYLEDGYLLAPDICLVRLLRGGEEVELLCANVERHTGLLLVCGHSIMPALAYRESDEEAYRLLFDLDLGYPDL